MEVPIDTTKGQLKFKRYPEVLNFESTNSLQKIVDEGYAHEKYEWVMLEKVHGANFSILIDGNNIEYAKRTSLLTSSDVFYGFQNVVKELEQPIKVAYQLLKNELDDVTEVVFYGELFGGRYPHPEVKIIEDVKHVQIGVYYSPKVHIYFFDIWVKNHSYISYDLFQSVCEKAGLFYAKALQRGQLNDLLKFDVDTFITTIPEYFNLPPINHLKNIAEGIVLKPVNNYYLKKSERVILKYKSSNFKEVSGLVKFGEKKKKPVKEVKDLPCEMQRYVEDMKRYATENRLRNVISKIGEIKKSDKHKLMGLFVQDISKDYMIDNEEFKSVSKQHQKMIITRLSKYVEKMMDKNWNNILNNEF